MTDTLIDHVTAAIYDEARVLGLVKHHWLNAGSDEQDAWRMIGERAAKAAISANRSAMSDKRVATRRKG